MKDANTNELLRTLMKCIAACENCATECLNEDDPRHLAECIRLDRDCADICALTARLVARSSAQAGAMLQLCAQVCKACEAECRKHDHDHCRKCAEACQECHRQCSSYTARSAAQHAVP